MFGSSIVSSPRSSLSGCMNEAMNKYFVRSMDNKLSRTNLQADFYCYALILQYLKNLHVTRPFTCSEGN